MSTGEDEDSRAEDPTDLDDQVMSFESVDDLDMEELEDSEDEDEDEDDSEDEMLQPIGEGA